MSNGWFTRKKITGGVGLGLVPSMMLIFVPFIIVGLVMWRSPFGNPEDFGGKPTKQQDQPGEIDVRGIASGATSFAGVKDKEREKTVIETSDRNRDSNTETPSAAADVSRKFSQEEGNDALSLAIAEPIEPPKGKGGQNVKLADEEGVPASKFDENGDRAVTGSSNESGGASGTIADQLGIASGTGGPKDAERIKVEELVVYRVSRITHKEPKRAADDSVMKKSEPLLLPRGHEIRVYFLQTVNSLDMESMVTLGVAENVIFNHKIVIPFGTRMLGRASNRTVRDRISIDVDTLIYPDGREVPISGLMKDLDGQSGVLGYYIPRPALTQLTPYIAGFTQAFMGSLLDRKTQVNVLGSGVTTESGLTSRNAFMEQASKLVADQVKQTQDEIMERNKPYVVIVAGSEGMVQLRTRLSLTNETATDAAKARDLPPGFENTPYRSDGTLQQQASAVIKTAKILTDEAGPAATQLVQRVATGAESR